MKKCGFSLVELLLYTALVLFVLPLVFGSLSSFLQTLVAVQKEQQTLLADSLVIDVLRRDLLSACSAQKINTDWFFKQQYIVANGKVVRWVCWRGTTRGAMRWSGTLDFARQCLLKKQTQCFTGSLQELCCEPVFVEKTTKLQGVIVTYRYGKQLKKTFLPTRAMRWTV